MADLEAGFVPHEGQELIDIDPIILALWRDAQLRGRADEADEWGIIPRETIVESVNQLLSALESNAHGDGMLGTITTARVITKADGSLGIRFKSNLASGKTIEGDL